MSFNIPAHYRRLSLSKRDLLSEDLRISYSSKISGILTSQKEYLSSYTPLFYVSFKSEVITHDIIKDRLKKNLKVAVPVTDTAQKRIQPCILRNWEDLMPGAYGVPEPDISHADLVPPDEIDLVIVPGSAFDETCGRYGYGGGYYDRFLANDAPQAKRVALAFQLQVFPRIPLGPYDQRMDVIITEEKIIRCNADKINLLL